MSLRTTMTVQCTSTTDLFNFLHSGVKAMCEQHGKKSIDAVIKCVPDWIAYKFDAATTERRFEQNADLCWKEIEPMFSECGLKNYGTVSRMVRDDIYKAAIKQDKDEQTRLHEIINTYAKFTVPNDKTTENYKCFRGALMVDFKPDTTLTPDEVTRMAGRLVNLVRKLDKNSEGQRVLY